MDKKKTITWLIVAVLLMALALVLRFLVSDMGDSRYRLGVVNYQLVVLPYLLKVLPFLLGVSSLVILFDVFHKNWVIVSGILLGMAALLRFVLRGYAWWGYLAAFVAVLVIAHRFLSKPLFRALMVLVSIGFAYFCFVEFFIIRDASTDRDCKRDYLVVLGAAVYGDEPSLTLVRRLEGALDYLEAYPESMVIVSGGMGEGETVTEAEAMQKWLVEHGVEEERILLENKATSTQENLAFSFEIIRQRGDEPDGNVAVCSSAYHLYRAKQMAKNMGVEAAGVSSPWGYFFVMLNYFIREAFGVTHLWAFGN